jgi:hypothetical protein
MILDAGAIRILTPSGALPRAAPTDGMNLLTECWFGNLAHEAAGSEDGDRTRRVRILRYEVLQTHDVAVIGTTPYLITRAYHGVDDDSGELITDLTLATGLRVFATVELIPEASGYDSVGTPTKGPNLTAAKATIAEVRSVAADEYYNAQVAGMELTLRALVYAVEYGNEAYIRYSGKVYPVRQTRYIGQRVELTCGVAI